MRSSLFLHPCYSSFSLLAIIPRVEFFLLYATSTTDTSTLSLHDALPIFGPMRSRTIGRHRSRLRPPPDRQARTATAVDRKSTRLNSSHANLVCRLLLEKKNRIHHHNRQHRTSEARSDQRAQRPRQTTAPR